MVSLTLFFLILYWIFFFFFKFPTGDKIFQHLYQGFRPFWGLDWILSYSLFLFHNYSVIISDRVSIIFCWGLWAASARWFEVRACSGRFGRFFELGFGFCVFYTNGVVAYVLGQRYFSICLKIFRFQLQIIIFSLFSAKLKHLDGNYLTLHWFGAAELLGKNWTSWWSSITVEAMDSATVAVPIPMRFVWPYGGRNVYLSGSFTQWVCC